jgi:hypothetical protein
VPRALAHFTDLAERVGAATREPLFLEAVRHFIGLLQSVPDSPPAEWSHESLAVVRKASEDVVNGIENWIERHETPASLERRLAREIYTIRGTLEEVDRWERHLLGSVN